jgi:hypothetical protein
MMPVMMNDDEGREEHRDYASLYYDLCDCAGPQPSVDNARADEHSRECPYRREVEGARRLESPE